MNNDNDFPLIETDVFPPLTEWQEIEFSRLETDLLSGVAWQPSVSTRPAPMKPTAEDMKTEILMEVASWFLSAENKYIKVDAPETRLGIFDVAKVAKPMMAARYAGTKFAPIVKKHAGGIVRACMESEPTDPRLAFGVWSGKTYAAPGNTSPRLYRKLPLGP